LAALYTQDDVLDDGRMLNWTHPPKNGLVMVMIDFVHRKTFCFVFVIKLASLEAEGGGTQVTIKLTHFYTNNVNLCELMLTFPPSFQSR
jgi:hypothetical protein